jgi:L-aminopeptidase/D-esterase-like protein
MLVQQCQAVVLSGGSAFGLASATGVVAWLAERNAGFPTSTRNVPVVPAAILYDLAIGSPRVFPGEREGYIAASRARGGAVKRGTVGSGTGASVAKVLGLEQAMKGGFGTASVVGPRGLVVGAAVACNAAGYLYDPWTGELVAGARRKERGFVPLHEALATRPAARDPLMESTSLVCVATNAVLDHRRLQRLAMQAHDGLARVVVPAHTFADGDVAFAIAMGPVEPAADDATTLGAMTVRAVERALLDAVRSATGAGGVPSVGEWPADGK